MDYEVEDLTSNYYDEDLEKLINNFRADHELDENGIIDKDLVELLDNLSKEVYLEREAKESVEEEVIEKTEEVEQTGGSEAESEKQEDLAMDVEEETNLEEEISLTESNNTNDESKKNENNSEQKENNIEVIEDNEETSDSKTAVTFSAVALSSDSLFTGISDERVVTLKINLGIMGFPVPGNTTTYFGPLTEEKVKEFQRSVGMDDSGIVDQELFKKLDDLANGETLQQGMYREDVLQLKLDLEKLGFKVSDNPTIYFGPATAKKVSEFQEQYSLDADGVAGPETLAKIQDLLSNISSSNTGDFDVLKTGVYHPRVVDLKIMLEKLGYFISNRPTDYYGPVTEAKVREFQKEHNLSVTGEIDTQTYRLIEELAAGNAFRSGDRHSRVIDLKIDLEKAGFKVSDNPTSLYGQITTQKVQEFQRAFSIPSHGIADSVTFNKLEEVLEEGLFPTLRINTYHRNVVTLKNMLENLGYFISNNPTDFFGSVTASKVREFQEDYRLDITGEVNKATFEYMENLVNQKTFKEGDRHPKVIQIKKDLEVLGFKVSDNPTLFYGSVTTSQVKAFQEAFGLSATGIADKQTQDKLKELVENSLKVGDDSQKVRELKLYLEMLGYVVSQNQTTYYGPVTASVVKDFQRDHGLPISGIVDNETFNFIEKSALEGALIEGIRNERVIELKENLAVMGFPVPGNTTNFYGTLTKESVMAFQSSVNFSPTGIADKRTINELSKRATGPLQQGMYRDDVVDLKIYLEIVGFPVPGNQTNFFGSGTADRVRAFQRAHNLSVTGIVNDQTWKKLLEQVELDRFPGPYTRTLERNDTGEDVRVLQQNLNDLGYTVTNSPTTTFGPATEAQIREFQKDNNLTVTGKADQETLKKLVEARGETLIFSMKGFGHGLGMSQWGAYGMAENGYNYRQIIDHYYTGVNIVNENNRATLINVGLQTNVSTSVTAGSSSSFEVRDINNNQLFGSSTQNVSVRFDSNSREFVVTRGNTTRRTSNTVRLIGGSNSTFNLDSKSGRNYRGEIRFIPVAGSNPTRMDIVNRVNLETYLQGVVPYEIVPSWNNIEVFKAQTLAARTYALRQVSLNSTRNFHVYDNELSQVYNGVPTGLHDNALIRQAINDTQGEVIKHGNTLIDALYSASAGGHTLDAEDVWGNFVSYLRGKPDPYDVYQYSDYWHTYSISLSKLSDIQAIKNYNLGKVTGLEILSHKNDSVNMVKLTFERGTREVRASQLRTWLGGRNLTSTKFKLIDVVK
ncbi:peptidoglycan-binding protein [Evansella clarkii]|uniref:peptidoglycan-binding protein n=1 Tax=Evansella clarkii TaxID=79879 RepID=UPI001431E42A|nr:peptidoglycan-binding protein [Evansella clarkii]